MPEPSVRRAGHRTAQTLARYPPAGFPSRLQIRRIVEPYAAISAEPPGPDTCASGGRGYGGPTYKKTSCPPSTRSPSLMRDSGLYCS